MMTEPNLFFLIHTRTNWVIAVGLREGLGICEDGNRILINEQAHFLFIALAGHGPREHPGKASAFYANAARAHILVNARRNNAWRLAREVVNQWGLYIRPWLGCLLQDEQGKIIEDSPVYRTLVDLTNNKRIKATDQYWNVSREKRQ